MTQAKLEKLQLQLQLQLLQRSHLQSSPGSARLGRQGGEDEGQRVLEKDDGMANGNGNGNGGSGLWLPLLGSCCYCCCCS